MPRDLSQLLGLALYLLAIILILTGAFLLLGWPMMLIAAGGIAVLIGMILYD